MKKGKNIDQKKIIAIISIILVLIVGMLILLNIFKEPSQPEEGYGLGEISLFGGDGGEISFNSPIDGSTYYSDSILVDVSTNPISEPHSVLVEYENDILFWLTMDHIGASGELIDVKNGYNFTEIADTLQDTGKFGDASIFDATDSYYRLTPDQPYFGDNGTLSFWFKPAMLYDETTTVDNYKTIVCMGASYFCIRIYHSGSSQAGKLSFKLENTAGATYLDSDQTSWNKDQWYHAVNTFEYNGIDTIMKLYLDGVLIGETSFAGLRDNPTANHYWTIGGYNTFNAAKLFNGSIDEVIAIDRTLNGDEIKSLYDANANQYSNTFGGLTVGSSYEFSAYSMAESGNKNNIKSIAYLSEPLPVISENDFTIVVIPDSQDYPRDGNFPEMNYQQNQWIVDNQAALNLQFVVHVGDLLYHPLHEYEWQIASVAQQILDDAGIPNSILPGNHEHEGYGIGGERDIHSDYDVYFPVSRYSNNSWWGGNMTNTNEHNYQLLTINGEDYIFMNLGWCPHQDEVDWADGILTTYSNRKAIFTTHAYLDETTSSTQSGVANCNRYGTGNTTYIWDMIKTHENVQIVLNGHEHDGTVPNSGEANLTSLNNAGKPVYQMMTSYQEYPNGGDGYIRLLVFRPDQDIIEVKTFSTNNLDYKTETKSNLILSYPLSITKTVNGLDWEINSSLVTDSIVEDSIVLTNTDSSNQNVIINNLKNALIYYSDNSIAGNSNINSNNGTIEVTITPNNYTYILNNFNLTEGITRKNSPLWISSNTLTEDVSNQDIREYHLASNLTDTINISFYAQQSCPDSISYTSELGVDSVPSFSCADGLVMINLTQYESAQASNVLKLYYDVEATNTGDNTGSSSSSSSTSTTTLTNQTDTTESPAEEETPKDESITDKIEEKIVDIIIPSKLVDKLINTVLGKIILDNILFFLISLIVLVIIFIKYFNNIKNGIKQLF